MAKTIRISPVTRIEGHLEIEVTVDRVGGRPEVVGARASSPMFRGFEAILAGRDPLDAVHYTQRVCGVCPVSHGMASSLALEDANAVVPAANGRILRNLVLGANFLQSHILHFYHLAAPDYIDTEGALPMSPWKPSFRSPDLIGGDLARDLVAHYVRALDMRRKAHRLGAIFGGRQPTTVSFVPGGSTETVTSSAISDFRILLAEILAFVDDVYLPDVAAVADRFPDYTGIGRGCGNLLAYGVFDLDNAGAAKLLRRGRWTDGEAGDVDPALVREYVSHSWYSEDSGAVNPGSGVTNPARDKATGYSWIKAPRYLETVHEVGPLARMWVAGEYRAGISVLDRLAARALETQLIGRAMEGWLDELTPGGPVYTSKAPAVSARGVGLTEAPRGALGHWLSIGSSRISRYQIVTPTAWNASPRDDRGTPGPIEQALLGTPVRNPEQPVEVMRVVHSFDPCVSCSVHMLRPGSSVPQVTVSDVPGMPQTRKGRN